ncbi:hypothetical protein GCM10009664_52840 [Kitasatospora gansuensis]
MKWVHQRDRCTQGRGELRETGGNPSRTFRRRARRTIPPSRSGHLETFRFAQFPAPLTWHHQSRKEEPTP